MLPNPETEQQSSSPAPACDTRGGITLMDREPVSLFRDRSAERDVL